VDRKSFVSESVAVELSIVVVFSADCLLFSEVRLNTVVSGKGFFFLSLAPYSISGVSRRGSVFESLLNVFNMKLLELPQLVVFRFSYTPHEYHMYMYFACQ
jgi:hypothetical protein